MTDVFVSYSRRDSTFAARITSQLLSEGRDVWIDHDDIPKAANWRAEIRSGVIATSTFLFILSPDSLASTECAKELAVAVEAGKRVVLVLYRDAIGPVPPGPLSDLNWIYLRDSDDWAQGVKDLARAIDTDLEWARYHARILERATEWEALGHRRSALLRGTDLTQAESQLGTARNRLQAQPTDLQRRYLLASRQAHTKQLRVVTGLSMAAVVAMVGLSAAALVQRSVAIGHAATSRAKELASRANAENDPYKAIAIALAARRTASIAEAHDALARAAQAAATQPATRSLAPFAPAGGLLTGVQFANTAPRLVTADDDGEIVLWNVQTGQPTGAQTGIRAAVSTMVFNPADDVLAVASDLGPIQLFDAVTLQARGAAMDAQRASSMRWSADGASLMSVGFDGVLQTWSTDTGALQTSLALADIGPLSAAAISPDATYVAGATIDGRVAVWDAASGALSTWALFDTRVSNLSIYSVTWSPDSRRLATSSLDHRVAVLNAATGLTVAEPAVGHDLGVLSVDWSPDGKRLASSSFDGSVRLWDAVTATPLGAPLHGHTNSVNNVRWSPDSAHLASVSDDRTAIVWDVPSAPVGAPSLQQNAPVRAARWLVDGRSFLVGGDDGVIVRRDARSGDVLTAYRAPGQTSAATAAVAALAVSPDGDRFASVDLAGQVQVWAISGALQSSLDLHGKTTQDEIDRYLPGDVVWSPDGGRLAATADDGKISIWRPGAATADLVIDAHDAWIMDLAWSPDGRTVASASQDRTVGLWDSRTGAVRHDALQLGDEMYAVVFSPDGVTLATGGRDKVITQWSTKSWQRSGPVLRGHFGRILDLSWAPDGHTLASGGPDRSVRLWDVRSGLQLGQPLVGHEEFVQSVDWSRDGARILSADDAGRIAVWDAMPQSALCRQALAALGPPGIKALNVGRPAKRCDANPPFGIERPLLPVVPGAFH